MVGRSAHLLYLRPIRDVCTRAHTTARQRIFCYKPSGYPYSLRLQHSSRRSAIVDKFANGGEKPVPLVVPTAPCKRCPQISTASCTVLRCTSPSGPGSLYTRVLLHIPLCLRQEHVVSAVVLQALNRLQPDGLQLTFDSMRPYPPPALRSKHPCIVSGWGEGAVSFRFAHLLRRSDIEVLLCVCWLDKVVLLVHCCVL